MSTPFPFTGSRRVLIGGLLRALLATVVVVVLYFVLPFDGLAAISPWISVPVALVGFSVLVLVQVRAIFRSAYPGVRGVEALGTTVPLFIVFFAAAYYLMGVADPSWFSEGMSKLDSLYFTITVFATVGFGDITATAPATRAVVTGQMVANLVVIGLGLRIILGAVQEARRRAGRPVAGDT
jgi:hypothetical protein